MTDVSVPRLYILRATYLLIVVGLGSSIWPVLLHGPPLTLMQGVARCLLAAITLMAAIGIRYPLKMLPLLLFELAWKSLWLVVIGLPAWFAGPLDAGTYETLKACLMGWVIFPFAMPWRYVWTRFVREPGDRWRRAAPGDTTTLRPAALVSS